MYLKGEDVTNCFCGLLHMKFIHLGMTLTAYFSLHEEGGRKAGGGKGVGNCLGF